MAENSSARQAENVQNVMIEVARTQLAAVTAALTFWGEWVKSADKYARKVRAELERVSEGGAVSKDFTGQLTDLTREYLREIIYAA